MPPSPTAEHGAGWRGRIETLRQRLDELDAAMQTGQWELLDQLAPRVDRAMREVAAQPGGPAPADAELLRQTLNLAAALQTRAATRQQQIQPLLRAWRPTGRADKPA